jgi:hypothetical protein
MPVSKCSLSRWLSRREFTLLRSTTLAAHLDRYAILPDLALITDPLKPAYMI